MIEEIKKQPEVITPVLVGAVLMPNGEVISFGKSIGFFNELKGSIFENKKK